LDVCELLLSLFSCSLAFTDQQDCTDAEECGADEDNDNEDAGPAVCGDLRTGGEVVGWHVESKVVQEVSGRILDVGFCVNCRHARWTIETVGDVEKDMGEPSTKCPGGVRIFEIHSYYT
jgi:hypothetical protein